MLPVSAFVGERELMNVFTPGTHGSTFGGNPLAAAVALEALCVIRDERLVEKSRIDGAYMFGRLRAIKSPALTATCVAAACGSASRSIRRSRPHARRASGF